MLDSIKHFFVSGFETLKGLLTLKWLDFKAWKGWTSLRALYLVFAVLFTCGLVFDINFFHWALPTYFVVCAFFETEPLLKVLNKLGLTEVKI